MKINDIFSQKDFDNHLNKIAAEIKERKSSVITKIEMNEADINKLKDYLVKDKNNYHYWGVPVHLQNELNPGRVKVHFANGKTEIKILKEQQL